MRGSPGPGSSGSRDSGGWREALRYAREGGVPKRSLRVAVVVGTLLNLINQGDAILGGGQVVWAKLLLTYVVAIAQLPHIVAGSADVAFAVWSGHASIADYLWRFLVPTLLGNTVGGVALVAFLNHAPLASELQDDPRHAIR